MQPGSTPRCGSSITPSAGVSGAGLSSTPSPSVRTARLPASWSQPPTHTTGRSRGPRRSSSRCRSARSATAAIPSAPSEANSPMLLPPRVEKLTQTSLLNATCRELILPHQSLTVLPIADRPTSARRCSGSHRALPGPPGRGGRVKAAWKALPNRPALFLFCCQNSKTPKTLSKVG